MAPTRETAAPDPTSLDDGALHTCAEDANYLGFVDAIYPNAQGCDSVWIRGADPNHTVDVAGASPAVVANSLDVGLGMACSSPARSRQSELVQVVANKVVVLAAVAASERGGHDVLHADQSEVEQTPNDYTEDGIVAPSTSPRPKVIVDLDWDIGEFSAGPVTCPTATAQFDVFMAPMQPPSVHGEDLWPTWDGTDDDCGSGPMMASPQCLPVSSDADFLEKPARSQSPRANLLPPTDDVELRFTPRPSRQKVIVHGASGIVARHMPKSQFHPPSQANGSCDLHGQSFGQPQDRWPFWTCQKTAGRGRFRDSPNFALKGTSQNEAAKKILAQAMGCATIDPHAASPGHMKDASYQPEQLTELPFLPSCLDNIAESVDTSQELEIPENELTTVVMETMEQRLGWRDFLSEMSSKKRATMLFASYDVEAEPPKYARPPPSRPHIEQHVESYRQSGKSPPRCVAPNGAGMRDGESPRTHCYRSMSSSELDGPWLQYEAVSPSASSSFDGHYGHQPVQAAVIPQGLPSSPLPRPRQHAACGPYGAPLGSRAQNGCQPERSNAGFGSATVTSLGAAAGMAVGVAASAIHLGASAVSSSSSRTLGAAVGCSPSTSKRSGQIPVNDGIADAPHGGDFLQERLGVSEADLAAHNKILDASCKEAALEKELGFGDPVSSRPSRQLDIPGGGYGEPPPFCPTAVPVSAG